MNLDTLLQILNDEENTYSNYTTQDILSEFNKYRRLIDKHESVHLHEKLKADWGVDGYWYPLKSPQPKSDEYLFLIDSSYEQYKQKLREELLKHNINSLFELREHGTHDNEYEIETVIFDPNYNGSEGYWFDHNMRWLIYVSHEDTITFAGKFISDLARKTLPDEIERITYYL